MLVSCFLLHCISCSLMAQVERVDEDRATMQAVDQVLEHLRHLSQAFLLSCAGKTVAHDIHHSIFMQRAPDLRSLKLEINTTLFSPQNSLSYPNDVVAVCACDLRVSLARGHSVLAIENLFPTSLHLGDAASPTLLTKRGVQSQSQQEATSTPEDLQLSTWQPPWSHLDLPLFFLQHIPLPPYRSFGHTASSLLLDRFA